MLDGPFRGSAAISLGLLTANHLRGPRYVRVFPDVYLPADVPIDLRVRSLAAYLLVRADGGVLAGHSAAILLGIDVAPPGAPAEILVARKYRGHPGLTVRYGLAEGADVTEAAGCRVTSPLRTAWDLARRSPLVEAVIAVDALARRGRFAPADLLARRRVRPGARGCRRLDEVVALADPRAESPMETRLRLALLRAGLPPPEVQYRIHDEHGFVLARVDLAYPARRLAVEYDGGTHYTRRQAERDRRRDATLAGYGWQTVRVGRDDVGSAQSVADVKAAFEHRTRAA